MRSLLVLLAAGALAACETMPEFMQTARPTGGPATISGPASAPQAAAFTPPPEQQLLELERQLSAAAQERGLGGALAGVMAPDDGISIRAGVVYSATEVERGLAPPANAGQMYWQPDRVHVSSSGDMGVTSGRYVQVINGAEAVQGRYVVVWRRAADGDWEVLTETRVPDPPRAARRR